MKVKNFENTIKWYDENAEEYANAAFKKASIDLIDQFMKFFTSEPNVLDAGCGHGRDCELLYQKGATVTGLDISKGLLAVARKRYPHLTFIQGDFLNLPFKKESFDGVWAYSSLVHLESIEDVIKSLQEFYRVLKKGGIMHVYVKEKTKGEIQEFVADKARYFRYFTPKELKQYIEETGFTIQQLTIRQSTSRKGLNWISIFAEK